MKKICLKVIKFYQLFISPLLPKSCRYYPTCSEYAIWQFKNNTFLKAFAFSFLRILRCNKLFNGGIDYPIVSKNFIISYKNSQIFAPVFWFIPYKDGKFYVIKDLKRKQQC
ncbi:membrane protein insertion efficiency factor YidD [Campylobacter sp. FMV-PI01]|uniref:Putative membrane protein insertion efficiency factor n=1 Tax=Campylobacter portucalensis TaxID=2608384 RepID=A0A6L5WK38_9BACT|nr:membrane protein insertion efficiency factor YidD [Campylobacter portucalensis]MSN96111.1 membrane protein insertion efficiency factor YidD [Campylobacter portucalensis]